ETISWLRPHDDGFPPRIQQIRASTGNPFAFLKSLADMNAIGGKLSDLDITDLCPSAFLINHPHCRPALMGDERGGRKHHRTIGYDFETRFDGRAKAERPVFIIDARAQRDCA